MSGSQTEIEPSNQPGMGAIPGDGGITFRVWAPHASEVFVAGSFNQWSKTANPLAGEGNGYWSSAVPNAHPGDEYRYMILNGDQELWRIDPYAREVTNSIGNALIPRPGFDWGDDHFQLAPWNELVIYEMHIGTFHDQADGGPGTLHTALEKLPYLQALGVNAIQLMPMAEFPGSFSWGYNPSHPFVVESDYGGPQALQAFVKAAHRHGLGVIVDVVYNHFGPDDLDLWSFDGWSENGGGGIYFYNDWRSATPWGHTRPDYSRGEVRQYLRDNALFWFQEYHVDGLRWDATAYIRNVHGNDNPADDLPDGWSFMQWIHEEIHKIYPNALTIAEDLRNNVWITKDVGGGGAGFGAQWDPQFVHPVRAALTTIDDNRRDLEAVRAALLHRYDEDAFHRVIYTESHDEVANGKSRLPEEIAPGDADNWFAKKRSALGAALLLTAPGIPMLFQGQEFLEDRWFHDQDPLDWSHVETYEGLLLLYRDLIHLRRNLHGATRGLCGQQISVHHVNHGVKVIAFHRWDQHGPGDDVIVMVNMTHQSLENYAIGLPQPGLWQMRFNSDWNGYDPAFGAVATGDVTTIEGECDGMPYHAPLNVGPYSAVILSQS